MIDAFAIGLAEVGQWQVILALFIGAIAGILVGAIPGMEPAGAMAIVLPITLTMEPLSGIILLLGCYGGAWYGGAIPAHLAPRRPDIQKSSCRYRIVAKLKPSQPMAVI